MGTDVMVRHLSFTHIHSSRVVRHAKVVGRQFTLWEEQHLNPKEQIFHQKLPPERLLFLPIFFKFSKLNFLRQSCLVSLDITTIGCGKLCSFACCAVVVRICYLTLFLNNWFLCLSRILNNLKTFLEIPETFSTVPFCLCWQNLSI